MQWVGNEPAGGTCIKTCIPNGYPYQTTMSVQLIQQWKKRLKQCCLRSHHVYKDIWSPVNDENLEDKRETDCYTVLCKENLLRLFTNLSRIFQFMNVHNALFCKLNNFHALALGSRTCVFCTSNCEIGCKHSTFTNVHYEHSQFSS